MPREGLVVVTAATLTLTDFLLARIAAEEDAARAAASGQRVTWATTANTAASVAGADAGLFILFNDPARVLAECEAKRRIMEQGRMSIRLSDETPDDGSPSAERIHGAATAWEAVLEQMAAVYADHPDYRDEWRV